MKAHFSIVVSTALLLATAWTSPGHLNNEPAAIAKVADTKVLDAGFSFFRTHRQGKSVVASWGLTSGEGIVGFQVQKTYEDPTDPYAYWEDVSVLPYSGSRSYKCTDNNVYPGYSNYRVVGQRADGSSIVSGIATLRIVSRG
jgi:hypothetical protein